MEVKIEIPANQTASLEVSKGSESICSQSLMASTIRITGHAEVCQVAYDAAIVSYDELLNVFWEIHDPTSLNRQGADRGEQYRSVIFYHTPQQSETARRSKEQLDRSGKYDKSIVTQIQPTSTYWLATEEHQQYLEKQRRSHQY